jgi:hypothetical protein
MTEGIQRSAVKRRALEQGLEKDLQVCKLLTPRVGIMLLRFFGSIWFYFGLAVPGCGQWVKG